MSKVPFAFCFAAIYFCTLPCYYASSQEPAGYPATIFKIESKKLLGVWHRIDSLNSTIEFVDSPAQLTLVNKNENPYYFSKDSIGNVLSNGFYPQWPPLNCEVAVANDTLTVRYSQVGYIGATVLYRRR